MPRVEVWSGDMKDYYGQGELIDHVDVYIFFNGKDHLLVEKEDRLFPIEILERQNGKPFIIHNNPKIKLDSGTICYGCQVWWKYV